MSWTPDLFIGELRPWPDSVVVTRGNRIDSRIYVPKAALTAKELRKCHVEAENAKLREERDMYIELVECMVYPDVPDQLQAENDKLRELVRAMATRLAYADRVVDGGVFDARLRREVAKMGVEVDA